jgi:hypothetical protein
MVVDFTDFGLWKVNSGPAMAQAAVPEPSSAAIAVALSILLFARARNFRARRRS